MDKRNTPPKRVNPTNNPHGWRRKIPRVIVLQLFLKYDLEYCDKAIKQIKFAIREKLWPAMHDKRHCAFVIVGFETPEQLLDRLRIQLTAEEISNYWAMIPVNNVKSRDGGIDALQTRVATAYAFIEKWKKPGKVIQSKRMSRTLGRGASGKKAIKFRKSGQNSHKPSNWL